MTTGQKIRLIRQKREMTQWQLSQAVGISPGAMLMIERGDRDCAPEILSKMAKELGVPESALSGD